MPPDCRTSLKFAFVDWDGVTRDAADKPVWTFFRSTTDAFQMTEEYGVPLTSAQIQNLTDCQGMDFDLWSLIQSTRTASLSNLGLQNSA